MRREELRRLFDPDFLRNRAKRVPESFNRFVGLEDVEDTEAAWSLTSCVDEKTVERQVGG